MKKNTWLLTLMLLFACATQKNISSQEHITQTAVAELSASDKNIIGLVSFAETEDGIKVSANISGLRPYSVHGIHVHETGKCEGPDFESAGEHFNPDNTAHGAPGTPEKHLGDFGNIVANSKGQARVDLLFNKEEIQDLAVFIDKAIILHTGPDDLVGQPAGNAGDRLACGPIKQRSGQEG